MSEKRNAVVVGLSVVAGGVLFWLAVTAPEAFRSLVTPPKAVEGQMDRLQFLADVVGSLAWPVTVIYLVHKFWASIATLLQDLTEFSFGGATAKFAKQVQRVREAADKLPPAGDEAPGEPLDWAAFAVNATGMIMETWKDVEAAAKEKLHQVAPSVNSRGPSDLLQKLRDSSAITEDEAEAIRAMIELRNVAAHRRVQVSEASLNAYRESADRLIASLKKSID